MHELLQSQSHFDHQKEQVRQHSSGLPAPGIQNLLAVEMADVEHMWIEKPDGTFLRSIVDNCIGIFDT
jgi:hypothetical protein